MVVRSLDSMSAAVKAAFRPMFVGRAFDAELAAFDREARDIQQRLVGGSPLEVAMDEITSDL